MTTITPRRIRSWIRNLVLLLLLVFGCPGSIFIVADIACNISINTWLPPYPGAEQVSVDYNFIRPNGMGATLRVFTTPDDPETVEAFYYQHILDLTNRNVPRGLGGTDFNAEPNPDGEGSVLALYSHCVL